jgi:hypothetical protein
VKTSRRAVDRGRRAAAIFPSMTSRQRRSSLRLATAARETVGENAWHGWSLACGASRFFFVAIVSAKESLGGSSVNVDWGDA